MDIRNLVEKSNIESEKFRNVMNGCSVLLKYSPIAENARKELKKRVFNNNVFEFGYFPKNNELNELLEYVSYEDLKYLNLFYEKYLHHNCYPELCKFGILSDHNLIMPYKNVYGDIIGLVGRNIVGNDDISKYKNSSLQKGLNLFGLYEAKKYIIKKDSVIIVEGQFDCISCHTNGYRNVVALGGVAFTKFHLFLLKRYTNNIYLLLDNDQAGKKEEENIVSKFGDKANISKIELPTCYKDIDRCLRVGGDSSFLNI